MKILYKVKYSTGKRDIFFLGKKIYSYSSHNNRKYSIAKLTLEEILNKISFFKDKEMQIIEKVKNKEKINVTFLVGLTSMFCSKPLMKKIINNNKFKVTILVVPDLRFGVKKAKENMLKTYNELKEYKEYIVLSDIDESKDEIELSAIADICFLPVPYDFSHYKYNLLNILNAGILPAMVNYGFFRAKYDREKLISAPVYSLYWKVFVETSYNLEEFINYSMIKGKNTVLTGYVKMDDYKSEDNINKDKRKTIMIAPHHSVPGGYNDILALSNFEKYSDLFLKLPDMYPNVDFIFRPHPALFSTLSKENFWGEDKVNNYINQIKSKKNVIYSTGGDYFNEFKKSDALIQDCGSYLVEYFYTLKPQCYLLKCPEDIDDKFVELGKKCLHNSYIAYNEVEIKKFIDNIIINGNDYKKQERIRFSQNEVMINYPNASSKVIEHFEAIFSL